MNKPCANCPFRKDSLKGWLGATRMTEIIKGESFVCHKTTSGKQSERKQCAGHMLLLTYNNEFYRLAKRLFPKFKLSGRELVFDTVTDAIKHHGLKRERF